MEFVINLFPLICEWQKIDEIFLSFRQQATMGGQRSIAAYVRAEFE